MLSPLLCCQTPFPPQRGREKSPGVLTPSPCCWTAPAQTQSNLGFSGTATRVWKPLLKLEIPFFQHPGPSFPERFSLVLLKAQKSPPWGIFSLLRGSENTTREKLLVSLVPPCISGSRCPRPCGQG